MVSSEPSIDVVIPTWNGSGVLEDCLEALAAEQTPHSVFVVDNGSSDATAEMVRDRFPAAQLIALVENLGFGAAVNRGVAAGSAEAVVLLNNDANVLPGFLDIIVAPLSFDGVGMVAGVMLVPETGLIDAAGVEIDRGLAHFAYMAGFTIEELDHPPHGLLGPSGGAAAFRREALEEVDGFDEQLFAYCEDIDLALRLRAAGWSCVLAPAAWVEHVGSATLGLRTARQAAVASRSRGYILGRWRVGPRWVMTELVIGFLDSFVLRSPAPLMGRIRGLRHGRRLPRRTAGADVLEPAMGWWASLRRRFEVTREYERRHAR
jgi:N-acetylglucosaminyl-diphospho-decaprenol L-rhamnosyltransferase